MNKQDDYPKVRASNLRAAVAGLDQIIADSLKRKAEFEAELRKLDPQAPAATDIDAIRNLLAKDVGRSQWSVEVAEANTPKGVTRKPIVLYKPGGPPYHLICQCETSYDAETIVQEHNALPTLLAAATRLEAERDDLKTRLAQPRYTFREGQITPIRDSDIEIDPQDAEGSDGNG